jgi:hypothetical protein
MLLVPPVISYREESAAVEQVRFLRDEGANMVWAVEHTVRNGQGEPVSGFDAQLERLARIRESETLRGEGGAGETSSAGSPTRLTFRLATKVPENWIPFLPADAQHAFQALGPTRPSIRLCRAQMLRNEASAAPEPIPAMTSLLDPTVADPLLWLDEETVPREGVQVSLTRQRVRWINGETYVWLGRNVSIGKGEGRSGLRFDVVTDSQR